MSNIFTKMVVIKFGSNIHNLLKEKRLEFLAEDKVRYTDRERVVRDVSYLEMAEILIWKAGYGDALATNFGVSVKVVKNMIIAERDKMEAKKK